MLHTNELPPRHLIIGLHGPTSSDMGFTGPVCKLLSKVNQMKFNPDFPKLLETELLIDLMHNILSNISSDQQMSYRLVKVMKSGSLPSDLQEI